MSRLFTRREKDEVCEVLRFTRFTEELQAGGETAKIHLSPKKKIKNPFDLFQFMNELWRARRVPEECK